MTLVLPCSICRRSFKAGDLYSVTVSPPDYIDLPDEGQHVDPGDPSDETKLRVQYCGDCIGETELPPLESENDDDTPEPYEP